MIFDSNVCTVNFIQLSLSMVQSMLIPEGPRLTRPKTPCSFVFTVNRNNSIVKNRLCLP